MYILGCLVVLNYFSTFVIHPIFGLRIYYYVFIYSDFIEGSSRRSVYNCTIDCHCNGHGRYSHHLSSTHILTDLDGGRESISQLVPYVIFHSYFTFQYSFILITAGSEQMSLVQLFVPAEVAHDTVAELGELGDVQFKDVRLR